MKNNIEKFIAHINEDKIQTVEEHCRNVGKICAERGKILNLENMGKFIGLLHDAGKLTEKFNKYIRGLTDIKRGAIDHAYAGAKYVSELCGENQESSALVSRVIASHHGLCDWLSECGKNNYKERISKDDGYQEIKENIKLIADEDEFRILAEKTNLEYKKLTEKMIQFIKGNIEKNKCKESYAFFLGMLERILLSVLVDADRTDTALFSEVQIPDEKNTIELENFWSEMKQKLDHKREGFSKKKDKISLQRQSISERCAEYAKKDVRICRLIVPTGGGKTLSSLRFAVDYCIRKKMERIIYVAPFMSILEQNSDEICSIVGNNDFIEHYSDAVAEFYSEKNQNECEEYEIHTERWDSPVIATTMVQFLNTLFSGKMSSVRRMHRLCKSVIIIDEVQAVPVKCHNIFNMAMNFLSEVCGATIILCSATQPLTTTSGFPIIIDKQYSMTGDYSLDFEVFRRTDIVSGITPYGYDYQEAADYCLDKFSENGNILVIVNTKSAALKIYEIIKCQVNDNVSVFHLSTNMCPAHRKNTISEIRKLLDSDKNKPVICVTTQLIEAGVDISFKCVVRSAAGLDSVIQAAGRCNRHGESEKNCPVYVIKIKEENLSKLNEIREGQDIFCNIMEYGVSGNIQSPEVVSDYYEKYYKKFSKKLSYNIEGSDESIMNLISLNKKRREINENTPVYCSQAFKTAGQAFEVIDSRTIDVIVPYDAKAKSLISRLETENKEIRQLLRETQKYTVGIYNYMKEKLSENHALRVLKCGAIVLEKSYYDDFKGVIIEGAEQELLIY